ncbi:hypothetical protein CBR_g39000 [Chara braunii]|uniref:Endonuclease/exonuclease/phosphatase domain-containing protein n=1 Tax=Chara braunii TaxID=69332 RepID=A0A388K0X3_CHABU|nr:hypothetical protein CBR_g39000 [Chara braunii]|eukprot:GBG63688.1 hypothetical protein CBR_g39000 [Chara braunii]
MALQVPLDDMPFIYTQIEMAIGKIPLAHPTDADPLRPALVNAKFDLVPEARPNMDVIRVETPKGDILEIKLATADTVRCKTCRQFFHMEQECRRKGGQRTDEGGASQGHHGNDWQQRTPSQIPLGYQGPLGPRSGTQAPSGAASHAVFIRNNPAFSPHGSRGGNELQGHLGNGCPGGLGGLMQGVGPIGSQGFYSVAQGGYQVGGPHRDSYGEVSQEQRLAVADSSATKANRSIKDNTGCLILTAITHVDEIIIGRDWNTVLDSPSDQRDQGCAKDVLALVDMMLDLDLQDVYRELRPAEPGYTWFSHRGRGRRLDYLLVGGSLKKQVINVEEANNPVSDHKPVIGFFNLAKEFKRGRGYFKLNTQNLQCEGLNQWTQGFWERWQKQKERFATVAEWWEVGSRIMSKLLDVFSRMLALTRNKEERKLRKKVQEAEEKMQRHPISDFT